MNGGSLKLSRAQKAQIFAGGAPAIRGEGKCPVGPGFELHLSSRVTVQVQEVRNRKGGGWSLRYTVLDKRDQPRILRRTPGIHNVTAADFNEEGDPKPLDAAEVKRAAEASAYTSAPTSLSDAGEAVDRKTQERFVKEGRTIDALREQKRRETWQKERDALSAYERFRVEIERADRLGTDVRRELAALLRTVENMRRKNDRRAA